MSSVLRFTVLSMTGKDLRLLFGESMCRIQLYLSFSSTSISGWQFVFLCFERCYILSRPKSNYTLTPKIYWSAMMLTIFTLITTFIVDAYVFLPNENTITVIFVKTVEKYCCYYTSEKILEITDYMYILLNLLRWSTHSLRSFLLITGSSIINHDVKLILNIFKINIKSFLNI
ncbi:unnamed protein product [Heterobilharzia americana]|nr:unnamed protein product [Heterobilharzia americana]